MGDFRIKINAVGGHGCDRDVKDGNRVYGCRRMGCPDCLARELVETMQRRGCSIKDAQLEHWPGEPNTVIDNLVTGIRTGSF